MRSGLRLRDGRLGVLCRFAGKPAALHTLLLGKKFVYAPKTGEAYYTKYAGKHHMGNETGCGYTNQTDKEEYPPRARAKMVFSLNNDGMEQTDGHKGTEADGCARKVERREHGILLFSGGKVKNVKVVTERAAHARLEFLSRAGFHDRYVAAEAFAEGNEGFSADNTVYLLYTTVEQFH